MGIGGIAPLILNLCTRWRWVVSFTPRPPYHEGERHLSNLFWIMKPCSPVSGRWPFEGKHCRILFFFLICRNSEDHKRNYGQNMLQVLSMEIGWHDFVWDVLRRIFESNIVPGLWSFIIYTFRYLIISVTKSEMGNTSSIYWEDEKYIETIIRNKWKRLTTGTNWDDNIKMDERIVREGVD
jgi:hypothetical protein